LCLLWVTISGKFFVGIESSAQARNLSILFGWTRFAFSLV